MTSHKFDPFARTLSGVSISKILLCGRVAAQQHGRVATWPQPLFFNEKMCGRNYYGVNSIILYKLLYYSIYLFNK